MAQGQDEASAQHTLPQASSLKSPGSDTRVRITAGPRVEVPGVIRFEGLTPTSDGTIVREEADTVRVRVDGDSDVTIVRPLRRAVGLITHSDPTRLLVDSGGGATVTIPRDAIAQYEVSKGRASRRRNVLIGVLVGGGLGAVIGFAAGSACHEEPSQGFGFGNCYMAAEGGGVIGLMFGAGGGALIGALVPRHERWSTRPLSQLPK
jgi:hypothetical protein